MNVERIEDNGSTDEGPGSEEGALEGRCVGSECGCQVTHGRSHLSRSTLREVPEA